MTELEERLAATGGAALRDELVAALAAMELRLRRQMAASLPREDFALAAALAAAAQASQEVLAAWPVEELAPAPPPHLQSSFTSHRRPPWS